MAFIDGIALRPRIHSREINRVDGHGNHTGIAHALRKVRPCLAGIPGLIDIVVRRDVDDIGILRMELNENDRVAAIAAEE